MDWVNTLSEKFDSNLQIIRLTVPVAASVGILLILRKTYAFSLFKSVHEIPQELITYNKTLRGCVKGVHDGWILSIQHVPIFFRNLERRKRFLGQDASPFQVAIAGVDPRSGCLEHLQKEVILQPIKVVPLEINSHGQLEAVVYIRKRFFSRSVCLNEDLIQKGLAVVHPQVGRSRSKASIKLSQKLLEAEVYAERKGRGVWKRLSFYERLKTWMSTVKDKLRLRPH